MNTMKALFAGATVAASALLWAACTTGAQRTRGAADGSAAQRVARDCRPTPKLLAVVLTAVAGLASWVPARRAAGVEPSTVLREDQV